MSRDLQAEALMGGTYRGTRVHALRPEPNPYRRSFCGLTVLIPTGRIFDPAHPKACANCLQQLVIAGVQVA